MSLVDFTGRQGKRKEKSVDCTELLVSSTKK